MPVFASTSAVPHSASSVEGATAALRSGLQDTSWQSKRAQKHTPGVSPWLAGSGATGGFPRVANWEQGLGETHCVTGRVSASRRSKEACRAHVWQRLTFRTTRG